ncbi:MAG: alternative ribosome rescue aminoacyl-tRNA hydrolase ArfB [Bdellovibrionales bacterium]
MIHLLENELQFFAVRSRGPGGQNVNKVSSAALLVWNFENSSVLYPEQKQLIRQKLANKINKEGELLLRSDEFRDLEKNKSRCKEKLAEFLAQALHKPKPRKATKPTRSSKMRKLESKHRRGEVKSTRRKVRYED